MISDFLKFGYAAILTVIVIGLAVDLVLGFSRRSGGCAVRSFRALSAASAAVQAFCAVA